MAESVDRPEQAEFREYCRRWLAENRPAPPSFRLPISAIELMTDDQRAYLHDWQKKCHAAGLVGTDYPKEYGLTPAWWQLEVRPRTMKAFAISAEAIVLEESPS